MATAPFPVITTADPERSLGSYREILGGIVTCEFPGARDDDDDEARSGWKLVEMRVYGFRT